MGFSRGARINPRWAPWILVLALAIGGVWMLNPGNASSPAAPTARAVLSPSGTGTLPERVEAGSGTLPPGILTPRAGEAGSSITGEAQRPDLWDGPGVAVDVLLKLLFVLGLAYALLALLRRFGPGAVWRDRQGQLRVLESANLAPNRTIYLVRAGDRQLLLGVTPTQITPLSEWELEQVAPDVPIPPSFAEAISTATGTSAATAETSGTNV
jgi:flagellar biosynthetic protein FliO